MFEAMNDAIERVGIIPVVVIRDAGNAVRLGKALSAAGVECAEITFRTGAAAASIRAMNENFPEMLIGAGTVLTTAQVDEAVEAGAKFIDSPVYDEEVVDYCIERGIPVYPGVATPSEAARAVKKGLKMVKFFPAEINGGLPAIDAICAIFKDLNFIASGGLNKHLMRDYLQSPHVAAVAGSWIVKSMYIEDGDYKRIEKLAREARYSADDARGLKG